MNIKESLFNKARELGADIMGIAPAALDAQSPGGPKDYERWLANGLNGGMGFLERGARQREDIRAWFPEARSVIMLGFSWPPRSVGDATGDKAAAADPGIGPAARGPMGRLAQYAVLPDYHEELRGRLKRLLDWFSHEACPGAKGKAFVDTSPVLERFYARRAGLGWVGKNAMLVSKTLGCRFFLAGAAVDQELEPDVPVPDGCGGCTRCLSACPTQAFKNPRVLDASRCIGYLTVERRGKPLAEEGLRVRIQDRVFGCDACTDACPCNQDASQGIFHPLMNALQPLSELLALDEASFDQRFAGTTVPRIGLPSMLCNALIAAANSNCRELLPAVQRLQEYPDSLVAQEARLCAERLTRDPSEDPVENLIK
ncbi:MAG: tRNA epoxyqueuosine(34) reductase QueG [Elusimicrobiota bacterium]|jgi:epoxyqueuosine reductase